MRGSVRASVGGIVAVGLLAGCAAARPAAVPVIQISVSHCGEGWTEPKTGAQTLRLSNTGTTTAEADLIDPGSGVVYQELEGLAPGTTREMRVTLGGGVYAVRCTADGADPIVGPKVRIAGNARPGPGVVPVTANELYGPVRQYRVYVSKGLDRLVARTAELKAAVDDGDLAAARAAWLPAHLAYERLGAAYGTFGDFDGEIDGRPEGLPRGVHDKDFTGFHRVEYGLWHGAQAGSLRKPADDLDAAVRALRKDFRGEQTDPADLGLRAHEILENTLQFQLTGQADQGSGSTLDTAAANLEGTREVLDVLRPLLVSRYAGLPGVDTWMDRVGRQLDALKGTPVTGLARADRERLNAAVGELLERLAPVATICVPRRTS